MNQNNATRMASQTEQKAIFRQGRDLLNQKDYQGALKLFNIVSLLLNRSLDLANNSMLVLVEGSNREIDCS